MKFVYMLFLVTVQLFTISCNNPDHFGKVLKLGGEAETYTGGKWQPLKKSGTINYHDTIRSTKGTVEISFRDSCRITLEPSTKLIVVDSSFNGKSYIFPIVISGGILCDVRHDTTDDFSFVVYTPVAYAGAYGTHFHVAHVSATSTSTINVFDGKVIAYSTADFSEPVQVIPGFTTTVIGVARPVKPVKIRYPQFRRVGYLFAPDVCEHYEVAFGFPVGPIPFPEAVIVPIPVVAEIVTPAPPPPPPPRPRHEQRRSNSNVNVSVSVHGSLPGFAGVPMPVPVVPVPSHHGHVPVPFVPMPVPMGVAAVPVPVPVPMGVAPLPVPVPVPMVGVIHGGGGGGRREHVTHARRKQ